jgi:hypothetical protein
VNNIVTIPKSNNVLGATFGRYPSYVAGILNSLKQIHFYVPCNKHKLRKIYEKCIAKKSAFKLRKITISC